MAHLLPFFSYLPGSNSVSVRPPSARPSDPHAMTNTALEAIASSNGKNALQLTVHVVVGEKGRISYGATTSRNGQASHFRRCCASQTTEIDERTLQRMRLLQYLNDA